VRLLARLVAVDEGGLGENPDVTAILRQKAVYSSLALPFRKHCNNTKMSRINITILCLGIVKKLDDTYQTCVGCLHVILSALYF
jgi:hypothetical protein